MAPTYRMPNDATVRRQAALAEVTDALCGARCAAQLAGLETSEFIVRELLLTVITQIDRASSGMLRLV